MNNPNKTVCFQNEHLEEMAAFRETGPAYPTDAIDEFATITYVESYEQKYDVVINCPVDKIPKERLAKWKMHQN